MFGVASTGISVVWLLEEGRGKNLKRFTDGRGGNVEPLGHYSLLHGIFFRFYKFIRYLPLAALSSLYNLQVPLQKSDIHEATTSDINFTTQRPKSPIYQHKHQLGLTTSLLYTSHAYRTPHPDQIYRIYRSIRIYAV